MNCDCIEKDEERLRERVTRPDMNPPKGGTVKRVSCSSMALMFSTGSFSLNIPFLIEWDLPSGKRKEKTVYLLATYCPFCGQPCAEKEAEEAAEDVNSASPQTVPVAPRQVPQT